MVAPAVEVVVGQILTKVIGGLIEAGLTQVEADARAKGQHTDAEQAAIAKRISKDVENLVSGAISDFDAEERRTRSRTKPE
jgi:hypothetical protein